MTRTPIKPKVPALDSVWMYDRMSWDQTTSNWTLTLVVQYLCMGMLISTSWASSNLQHTDGQARRSRSPHGPPPTMLQSGTVRANVAPSVERSEHHQGTVGGMQATVAPSGAPSRASMQPDCPSIARDTVYRETS